MADITIRICDVQHDDQYLSEERRRFGLDGVDYEIDLCADDNGTFTEVFEPYLKVARRVSRKKGGYPAVTAARATSDSAAIRAWALENGYQVNDRGSIPLSVRQAYDNANGWATHD
jgi:hypothetical protein